MCTTPRTCPDSWTAQPRATAADADAKYTRGTAPDIAIGNLGARLRGYASLTDIEVVNLAPAALAMGGGAVAPAGGAR